MFDSVIKAISGTYLSPQTITDVSTNGRAVARITKRRGIITAPDHLEAYATSGNIDNLFDVNVSTTAPYTGFATATLPFFDGSDAGFGVTARYIKIPMLNYTNIGISLYNALGVSLTVELYTSLITGNASSSQHLSKISSVSIATSTNMNFGSGAGGPSAGTYTQVEALANPAANVVIGLIPASDPSSGEIRFYSVRRS